MATNLKWTLVDEDHTPIGPLSTDDFDGITMLFGAEAARDAAKAYGLKEPVTT